MPHTIEPAASSRAKCRGCGEKIEKDTLRFGERLPNPFGDGDMTLWFHPVCGAYKRPEPLLEVMATTDADLETTATPADPGGARKWLEEQCRLGLAHRRLPRLDGTGRAPTGRARCRNCKEPIAKDAWRIGLVFFEEGYFNPSGYVHSACIRDYFEAADLAGDQLLARIAHFAPDLDGNALAEIAAELG